MPSASTPPVVISPNRPPIALLHLMIVRLVQLNAADATLAALLTEYQTTTGQALG